MRPCSPARISIHSLLCYKEESRAISERKGLIKGQLKMDFGPSVLCSCCHYPPPTSTQPFLGSFLSSDRSCFGLQPTLCQVYSSPPRLWVGQSFLKESVTRVCLSLPSFFLYFASFKPPKRSPQDTPPVSQPTGSPVSGVLALALKGPTFRYAGVELGIWF